MPTVTQTKANQQNALKSTGPASETGKAVASQNATRHGLLSQRLFLDGEDPADFRDLMDELWQSLRPVGTLEATLVERIAVTIWRQRRLVSAESAAVELARQPNKVARSVSNVMGLSFSQHVNESDLEPYDKEHEDWCRKVIVESDAIEDFDDEIDLKALKKAAPLIYGQLASDAEEDNDSIESFVKDYEGGFIAYLMELLSYCRKEISTAEKRPRILALAEQMRTKRLILPAETLEVFARYQTTLDNQLYKTLRALREAQEWRLKTLDAEPAEASPPETKVT